MLRTKQPDQHLRGACRGVAGDDSLTVQLQPMVVQRLTNLRCPQHLATVLVADGVSAVEDVDDFAPLYGMQPAVGADVDDVEARHAPPGLLRESRALLMSNFRNPLEGPDGEKLDRVATQISIVEMLAAEGAVPPPASFLPGQAEAGDGVAWRTDAAPYVVPVEGIRRLSRAGWAAGTPSGPSRWPPSRRRAPPWLP